MPDVDSCICCGSELILDRVDSWEFNGQVVNVSGSSIPWILIDVNDVEVALCEECYLGRKYLSLSGVNLEEVDYQFSLEYDQLNKYDRALKAIDDAIMRNPCDRYFYFRDILRKKR